MTFSEPIDLFDLANASIYGLAAGVWTRDIGKAHDVARRLQAGTVWINQYNWYDSGSPFEQPQGRRRASRLT